MAESNNVEDQGQPATATVRRKRSMFGDPLVKGMAIGAGVLVMLYLITVVSALLTGVVGSDQPRTRLERDIKIFEQETVAQPKNALVWATFIRALIADKEYRRAQDTIDKAMKVADQSRSQAITTTQAELYFAQGDYDQAIKLIDKTRKQMKDRYEVQKKKKGTPEYLGESINDNYWGMLLVKAEALVELGKKKEALKPLDEYIAANVGASDVLIRRGQLRVELGDKKGAEADFREALKFIPDDQQALDGLKQIGATR